MTFHGTVLPKQTEKISGQSVQKILEYGYVDNKPNKDVDGTSFDISWAVNENGKPVNLPSIDFVRVYTAVDENGGVSSSHPAFDDFEQKIRQETRKSCHH